MPPTPPVAAVSNTVKVFAEGYIKSISPSRFKGLLRNEHGSYLVAGIFGNSVPTFHSVRAVFSSTRADGLVGTKPIEGKIGPAYFKLMTGDGSSEISGPLDMPIDPTTTVCGAITFSHA
ncbi:hypothetical protein CPB83DRAFT_846299 [Crepidotus variabilis]|uniref:Uncharacterized protein n=1 Tax=Crepidotus variabilis TaxID=179855 RepID=A0A9P6JTT6_9AGAR|nr:hypothetical protein CPB83DRAFT_846299 [Crepidotus variabilis]